MSNKPIDSQGDNEDLSPSNSNDDQNKAYSLEPTTNIDEEIEIKNDLEIQPTFDEKSRKIVDEIKKLYLEVQEIIGSKEPLAQKIAKMFVDAQIQEQTNPVLEEDIQSFKTYKHEADEWINRSKKLLNALESVCPICEKKLSESKQVQEAWSNELKEKLRNRQEGLDLIGKMLERLPTQAQVIFEEEEKSLEELEELPQFNYENLRDILDKETNLETVQVVLERQINNIGNQRWQMVTKIRTIAEKYENRFRDFLKNKLLPIMDAIDSGKLNSESLLEEIQSKYSESDLNTWFSIYGFLDEHLLQLLEQVGVQRMNVQIGTMVDYNCHEPLNTEPDPSSPEESIKKVTRQGYEYQSRTNAQKVLRDAQVVVVKNN